MSATSNLDSLQGYSGLKEGTVKVSEIYTLSIAGEEKLSFEVTAARLLGNSQTLTYVFGGIGGVMAALGVVSLARGVVRKLKNKQFKAP